MPKNNKATVSTTQITQGIGKSSKPKEAIIPTPQTLKIIFLIFLRFGNWSFGVFVLVNKNNELIASIAKKAIAHTVWIILLTPDGILKIVTTG